RDSLFFFSSRRRHTRSKRDWSSDVCSSDLDERVTRDSSETGRSESMQPPQDQQRQSKPNVVSIQSAKKSAEVYLAEPRVYSEARSEERRVGKECRSRTWPEQ